MPSLEQTCAIVDELLPFRNQAGVCDACGKPLTGRRTRWCSTDCSYTFENHHIWNWARSAARYRDKNRCVKCGRGYATGYWKLEVNHIEPRVGEGYGRGCWNHLANLETLCHDCHVIVTKEQAAERRQYFKASEQAREDAATGRTPMFDLGGA